MVEAFGGLAVPLAFARTARTFRKGNVILNLKRILVEPRSECFDSL
jgi:hypothetical protein